MAQGARKGFGGIKARNLNASAWGNVPLPDREEGWYHESEIMRAVDSIQRCQKPQNRGAICLKI